MDCKHINWQCNFNPRSREGSDYILQDFLFPLLYFNPRSREGSDLLSTLVNRLLNQFQSTLPRGERLQFYLKFTLCF